MLFRVSALLTFEHGQSSSPSRREDHARDTTTRGHIFKSPLGIVPSSLLHACPPGTLKDADEGYMALRPKDDMVMTCPSLGLLPLHKIPQASAMCETRISSS